MCDRRTQESIAQLGCHNLRLMTPPVDSVLSASDRPIHKRNHGNRHGAQSVEEDVMIYLVKLYGAVIVGGLAIAVLFFLISAVTLFAYSAVSACLALARSHWHIGRMSLVHDLPNHNKPHWQ